MKEFLKSKNGKIISIVGGLLVLVIIICLLLFSCGSEKKNDGKVNDDNGEGLVVIEEGEEIEDDVIDASDWDDLGVEDDKATNSSTKKDTDKDGVVDSKDDDDDNDGIKDKDDDDDNNDGVLDKDDPEHPSNTDKEPEKEPVEEDYTNNENVQQDTSTSWGPFF